MASAVIDLITGVILNMIVVGESDPAPAGTKLVKIPKGLPVEQTWKHDGQSFIEPDRYAVISDTGEVKEILAVSSGASAPEKGVTVKIPKNSEAMVGGTWSDADGFVKMPERKL